jgi:hypothetical protein
MLSTSEGNFGSASIGRDERVAEALRQAVQTMNEAGFELRRPVGFVIDANLLFMGYTLPQDGRFTIVVSGMAADSKMLGGLLMHELSHIYRMQTNDPSHNGHLLTEAMRSLGSRGLSDVYKQRIIRDLVNDIQDLYADEIAVRLMTQSGAVSKRELTAFFQSWVKDEPVESGNTKRDRWLNLAIMAKNARAIGQMRKQAIPDTGDKAASSNERFLALLPGELSRHNTYFEKLLSNLKEDVSADAYRGFLTDYLNKFVRVAEGDEAEGGV